MRRRHIYQAGAMPGFAASARKKLVVLFIQCPSRPREIACDTLLSGVSENRRNRKLHSVAQGVQDRSYLQDSSLLEYFRVR